MGRTIVALFTLCALAAAEERPPVKCMENSPERRGEEGCTDSGESAPGRVDEQANVLAR